MKDKEDQDPCRARRRGASEQTAFWLPGPIFGRDWHRSSKASCAPQRALCRQLGLTALALTAGLVTPAVSQARFAVTEGRGYVLCERVVAHMNRLTDSGNAARLWLHHETPLLVIEYPEKQSLSITTFKPEKSAPT